MAKNAGLPWDCVLSAELFGHYKPDPEVYQGAARLLGLAPGELMIVAAHPRDLEAGQRVGLKTGYVPRPVAYGLDGRHETGPHAVVDVTAGDVLGHPSRLGCYSIR